MISGNLIHENLLLGEPRMTTNSVKNAAKAVDFVPRLGRRPGSTGRRLTTSEESGQLAAPDDEHEVTSVDPMEKALVRARITRA